MTRSSCRLFAAGVALALLGCQRENDREPMTPASGVTPNRSESKGDGAADSETGFMGTDDDDTTRSGATGANAGTTGSITPSSDPKNPDAPAPSSGTTGHGNAGVQ